MKYLVLLFLMWGIGFAEVIDDLSDLVIATPTLQRVSRKLRLENGLSALLISDPGTPLSGAALAVGVGNFDDPPAFPGMAHFVEHLLFLGTAKYPQEDEFCRFLDEHAGMSNACTLTDRTLYMFSVANDALVPAIDRFSEFFIAPLFNPSGIGREMLAIEQEFRKDLSLDSWRTLYVAKELSSTKHPFHTFCIGNLETLQKISREDVLTWVEGHYSADLMHLVVYSPLDLESLEKLVTEKFSPIRQRKTSLMHTEMPLFEKENLGKLVMVEPLLERRQLELSWEIPLQDPEVKPAELISHILGHEGEGSLFLQLKKEGLIDSLGSAVSHVGRESHLFTLSFHLTQKGLKEYDKVILRTFEAIASLKLSGIPRYIFDEVYTQSLLKYRFQSRENLFDFVKDYAMDMVDEPLATFPRHTLMPTRYDPEKIYETLFCLTPDKCQYFLIAPKETGRNVTSLQEKWFGVSYALKPLPKKKLKSWTLCTPHPDISLPPANPYLSDKIKLLDVVGFETPLLLEESSLGKCYFKIDDSFKVPEVSWSFTFKTPLITESDPKSQVLADLYCHMIQEALLAKSYSASLAHLRYHLEPSANGITLTVEGFHEKAPLFLSEVMGAMKNTEPRKESFVSYKDLAKRVYARDVALSPLTQAKELLLGALYKNYAGPQQKGEALTLLSFDHFKKFCQQIWQHCYIEALLYGNMEKELAKEIWHKTLAHFPASEPYDVAKHYHPETASFGGSFLLTRTHELPSHALILALDLGPFSFKEQAAMDILSMGLREPFFNELRTKQQTAYLVRNWAEERERHLYAFFAVQSSTHEPRDLLARFDLFLESTASLLKEEVISCERFEALKASLLEKLHNPTENLLLEGKLLKKLAFDYGGNFHWLKERIAATEALSYEDFISFAQKILGKNGRSRLAICVEGKEKTPLHYETLSSLEKLKKRIQYRGNS